MRDKQNNDNNNASSAQRPQRRDKLKQKCHRGKQSKQKYTGPTMSSRKNRVEVPLSNPVFVPTHKTAARCYILLYRSSRSGQHNPMPFKVTVDGTTVERSLKSGKHVLIGVKPGTHAIELHLRCSTMLSGLDQKLLVMKLKEEQIHFFEVSIHGGPPRTKIYDLGRHVCPPGMPLLPPKVRPQKFASCPAIPTHRPQQQQQPSPNHACPPAVVYVIMDGQARPCVPVGLQPPGPLPQQPYPHRYPPQQQQQQQHHPQRQMLPPYPVMEGALPPPVPQQHHKPPISSPPSSQSDPSTSGSSIYPSTPASMASSYYASSPTPTYSQSDDGPSSSPSPSPSAMPSTPCTTPQQSLQSSTDSTPAVSHWWDGQGRPISLELFRSPINTGIWQAPLLQQQQQPGLRRQTSQPCNIGASGASKQPPHGQSMPSSNDDRTPNSSTDNTKIIHFPRPRYPPYDAGSGAIPLQSNIYHHPTTLV